MTGLDSEDDRLYCYGLANRPHLGPGAWRCRQGLLEHQRRYLSHAPQTARAQVGAGLNTFYLTSRLIGGPLLACAVLLVAIVNHWLTGHRWEGTFGMIGAYALMLFPYCTIFDACRWYKARRANPIRTAGQDKFRAALIASVGIIFTGGLITAWGIGDLYR